MSTEQLNLDTENDKGFKSKRAILFSLSLLLLALAATGAQVKEANTLIFKIEFTRYENLQWLLVAGVLYSALRYYAYSEKYRKRLFEQWSGKLLEDSSVYYYAHDTDEIEGLVGGAVNVWGGDEPGIQDPRYVKKGILKRAISYPTRFEHEYYGEVSTRNHINLNEYTDKWSKKHFRKLLGYEFKYRWEAWVSHRETLDLMAPYLLAAVALLAFLYTKLVA